MISSTTLFNTSLSHPYVFCTTFPSLERVVYKGEWSFISPVGSAPVRVNNGLLHDLTRLGDSGPILAGAVSPHGRVIAMVERLGRHQGRVIIMPVVDAKAGGLSTLDPIVLHEGTLVVQDNEITSISPTAIRFHEMEQGFRLIAVDIEGKVIRRDF